MQQQTIGWVFYAVFLSQVLLLSFFLPRQVLGRLKFVVDSFPPTQYPKLYPVTMGEVERAQRNYRLMNLFALAVGLILVAVGLGWPTRNLIDWDNELISLAYMLLQFSPMIIALGAGFTYFNLKRRADLSTTRKAELRPRRLFDFVSPAVVGLAAVVYVAFVALIIYVRQFDYPWFGGYLNIVIMTIMNLFFAGLIAYNLYGKKKDPYQSSVDRAQYIRLTIRAMVWTSILMTLFVAISIGLSAFELGQLKPIALSVYVQLLALLSFQSFRIDDVDFEVYREDPVAA